MIKKGKRVSRQELAEIERQKEIERAKMAFHNANEGIKSMLMAENFQQAEKAIEDLYKGHKRKDIPGEFLLHIAQGYCRAKNWKEADRVLNEMENNNPRFKKIPSTIVKAYYFAQDGRPRRAIRTLETLDDQPLSAEFASAYREILFMSQQAILDGCVEVE